MRLLSFALRNLTRHRRRTWLTASTLALGIAVVTVSRGYIDAQHTLMLEGAVRGDLGAVVVQLRGARAASARSPLSFDFADTAELRARVAAVPGVIAVAPRIQLAAMLSLPAGGSSWLTVTAIEPESEREVTPRRFTLVGAGRALARGDQNALWLQEEVAHGLGLTVPTRGDDEAEWPALLARDRDEAANGLALEVVGTLQSAVPGDRRVAVLPLSAAQRLLRMEGRVTSYAVAVEPLERAPAVAAALRAALGEGFEVSEWAQLAPLLFELHGYQDRVFALLSGLLLAVVVLTALNNMLMNVLERTREIGTLLALGLRRREIARLFLLEGVLLGAAAGALGVGVGLVAVRALAAAKLQLVLAGTSTPAVLEFHVGARFAVWLLGLSATCTALAALWPAWQASRLVPVVALRAR
ncbi:MAG: ABC transporter permease [Archangiaceae bacterium]|nr:ABC transporter permease [Archangiaceae bacterium]